MILSLSYYFKKTLNKFSKYNNTIVKSPIIYIYIYIYHKINQLKYGWIFESLLYKAWYCLFS